MNVEELKKEPIWVLWKKEVRDDIPTKVPYQPSGRHASISDPQTWGTYHELANFPGFDGVGIVFEKENNIIGIDFDNCAKDGRITDPQVADFLRRAKTYCEVSPSGTGIHMLFHATEPIQVIRNKYQLDSGAKMEVYTRGRYFTFTGDRHHESPTEALSVDQDLFLQLLSIIVDPYEGKPRVETKDVPPERSDKDVLSLMFSAKNGERTKKLYDGDTSQHNDDDSSADLALCMHFAFWTGNNREQIRRLWLASPLGSRKKTQKRVDYQDRTIDQAIQNTPRVYAPHVPRDDSDIAYDFISEARKDGTVALLIVANIARILRKHPNFTGAFRKNEHSHMVEYIDEYQEWTILNDGVVMRTRVFISENFPDFRRVSSQMVRDAIILVANENKVNPPRDYYTSLVWDGTPRLNSWLHHVFGTPDDNVHQAIGSNWLKGLIKRVMQPGCQFDEVLVLESPQGWRKSTALRILGEPWHVETSHDLNNKDFYLTLAQNVIVEFSEGEILNRASVQRLKAEITKTEDQIRPPYESGIVKFPRACVFALTTNKLELKDDTGNRRWLPVQLKKIADVDWLKRHKEQLLAEAFHRVVVKQETTHEYPDEITDLQEEHQEYSDHEEELWDMFRTLGSINDEGVSLTYICSRLFPEERVSEIDKVRICGALRRMGFDNKRRWVGGKQVRRWVPDEKAIKKLEQIQTYDESF